MDFKGIKLKNKLENINGDFFLKLLFTNLLKEKKLDLIKYNKNLQKRFNINLNDYKDYSEIYSPIEIEIITVEKKYGNFINILKKEEEKYFHIFFNDSKDEIKRNYLNENDKTTKIRVVIDYKIISFYQLFFKCKCIESIIFKKFNRKNINNMSRMFYGCSFLKEIKLFKFKTNNITDMSYMFSYCSLLKELDLSNFDIFKVINFSFMFYKCSSLTKIILSNLNINKNMIYMTYIFFKSLSKNGSNISDINCNNKVGMSYLLGESSIIREENISNLNFEFSIDSSDMFFGCPNVLKICLKN